MVTTRSDGGGEPLLDVVRADRIDKIARQYKKLTTLAPLLGYGTKENPDVQSLKDFLNSINVNAIFNELRVDLIIPKQEAARRENK